MNIHYIEFDQIMARDEAADKAEAEWRCYQDDADREEMARRNRQRERATELADLAAEEHGD